MAENGNMPMPEFLTAIREAAGPVMVLMPSITAVVRDERGHVLVMRRADTGRWSLPSGICEPGEPPALTTVRELREEAGLTVEPTRLLTVFSTPPIEYANGVATYVGSLFECRVVTGTLEAVDGEALDLRWMPLDELPALDGMQILDWFPRPLAELLASEAGGRPGLTYAWDPAWLTP